MRAINEFASMFASDPSILDIMKKLTKHAVNGAEYTFSELSPVTSFNGLELTSRGMWRFSKPDRHDFTSNEVWTLAKSMLYGEIQGETILEIRRNSYRMAVNAAAIETAFGHVEDRIHRQVIMPRAHPATSWMVCHWLLSDYLEHHAKEDLGVEEDGADVMRRLQNFVLAAELNSSPSNLPAYFTLL